MNESHHGDAETQSLLLEIGCEEIPARFLSQAQKELGERLRSALEEARLLPPTVGAVREPPLQTYSTPRRLVAHVAAVLERQPNLTEEVTGPPVKVAFDKDGQPTRAAESFAAKNGATVDDLYRVTTPKGEYLAVKRTTYGRPALEVLVELLPAVITGMSFPKSMYWERSRMRFVRPIRWLLALLGEAEAACVVPFGVAGVVSGNRTYGHRLAGGSGIAVAGFRDYAAKLRAAYVEIDSETRRQAVRSDVNALLEDYLDDVVPDQGLENWIVDSTEWLSGIRGAFDERFLRLPREILITVMRDHQKYFAVQDDAGKLRPHFITFLNRDGDPSGSIRAGHERVLTARFSDAEFFWNADQKVTLAERFEEGWLDKVTYQAKLGSYGDKVRRMVSLARSICNTLQEQGQLTAGGAEHALRAVRLCKCDLTTQMVQEFTELQGVVGGLYATAQGEPQEIADAIYDHYLPQGIEDIGPRSLVGAVVALADKIDAVAGGFIANLRPTGSSDPFGLRRQGNGAIRILLERAILANLRNLALDVIDGASHHDHTLFIDTPKAQALADEIVGFFRERLSFYLETVEQLSPDVVRAALSTSDRAAWGAYRDDALNVRQRARACASVHDDAEFLGLCVAAKRIRNILSKSASGAESLGAQFNPGLFSADEEIALGQAILNTESGAGSLPVEGEDRFHAALLHIAKLRGPVDRFFDTVLVMDGNLQIKENRLRLLNRLNQLFSAIVDLSQIESKTLSNVDAPTS